jgi:Na+/H+ antiporter NhaD/arsenite permease-like protein
VLFPLAIFTGTYLVLSGVRPSLVRLDRTSGALVGAVLMVVAGGLTSAEAYAAIHWETIVLLLGMMVITSYLVEARFFRWVAWQTVTHARSARQLLYMLIAVAGAASALLVNDTVCVMFTPLVVAVIEEAELPAEPYLIALASASNIGGVVTFTGNPQNMIVGTHAHMSFLHYTLRMLPVGAIGLLVDGAVLGSLYANQLPRAPLRRPTAAEPALDRALLSRALLAVALVLAGFLLGKPLAGTAVAGGALLILLARRPPRDAIGRIDFSLLLFFGALFVVVAGVERSGALAVANGWIVPRLGGSVAAQLTTFSLVTVVGSNVFSNVPWVMLAVKLVPLLGDPERGWMALAMASTLAGNLTILGSVANLIVLELAGEHGRIGFLRFLRTGFLITASTLGVGLGILLLERWLGW